jgi:hypothetical protein
MADHTNYPDVLGFLTGNVRLDMGTLQVAAAVRPKIVTAGRPFQVVIVLQNTTDAEVEVTANVLVPNSDFGGQKARFLLKTQRVAVGVAASEVGVLTFPVGTLPDTTPGKDYRVQVQLTVKPADKTADKAARVRQSNGGGALYLEGLPRPVQADLARYRGLAFTGGKKGLLGANATLEPAFGITKGELGQIINAAPEYKPLWTLADLHEDPRILLERHHGLITQYLLPSLDRSRMLVPLVRATEKRFSDAGYDLKTVEAEMISRLLALVLEYACTGQLSYGRSYITPKEYELLRLVTQSPREREPIKHPRWFIKMLEVVDADERAARFVSKYLPEQAYDELLHDALIHGLNIYETATGSELGSQEELAEYAEGWMQKWQNKSEPLKFEDVYLPLVIAGLVIHEDMNPPDVDVRTLHPQFVRMLPARKDEVTTQNYRLFRVVRVQLEGFLHKYGLTLLDDEHRED